MQTHEYATLYDVLTRGQKPRPDVQAWYAQQVATMADPILRAQTESEARWIEADRPYYTIYPVAQDALGRVRLDLPCEIVRLPLPTLLLRFGNGQEPLCDGRKLRTIFAAAVTVRGKENGLGVWCDFGEQRSLGPIKDFPIYSYLSFSLAGERSVEEAITDLDQVEQDHESSAVTAALRYVIAVCLLGEESELVDPDILSKDRAAWDAAQTDEQRQAIIDRAQRRGKRGWLVGAHVEVAPHLRRPHVGLRWTGEGKKVPRIVPISGSIVRRKRLSDVPTGFLGHSVD